MFRTSDSEGESHLRNVIFIPVRYPSVRFPGKPLAMLRGVIGDARPLIRRIRDVACEVAGICAVYVLTNDRLFPLTGLQHREHERRVALMLGDRRPDGHAPVGKFNLRGARIALVIADLFLG